MRRLVLLHTNDVHGRIEGLARVATLVEGIRAEESAPVLYLDGGDVEETTVRLSSLTKGAALHRILSAAGCDVATVGNAVWLRYGPQALAANAAAADYPLLLANLVPVEGVLPSVVLNAGDWRVGVIGVTDDFAGVFGDFDFGMRSLPVVPLVRELARDLRVRGADLVIVLSHLGWRASPQRRPDVVTDRLLAEELQDEIDLVIGAHSHDLLPEGEWVGRVLVAQAGAYAEHLGRVEVRDDGMSASVLPVGEEVPYHEAVLATAEQAERELEAHLDELIAELECPLDAAFVADVFRQRFDADVGLAVEFATLDEPIPAGPLRRGDLWAVCHSSGNPGVVELSGAQLRKLLERGATPEFRNSAPNALRGRPQGRLFAVGADEIDPERTYRVAGSDWELGGLSGLADAEWGLSPDYDFPTIVREAVEEHLARRRAESRDPTGSRAPG
jgi:2',3'-cyclic-nucleotide 2'-phosphodiesterase (5'-nucleotidase family)